MPQADPIVRASQVRLVDDNYSTEKRERVAEFIDEHWNENNGLTLTEIANETKTSRQHVKNVLTDHFEMVHEQETMDSNRSQTPPIPDREGIDTELLGKLLTAYRMGCRDVQNDEIEPGISEELLRLATRD